MEKIEIIALIIEGIFILLILELKQGKKILKNWRKNEMVKLIIEIEEKETVSYKGVKALGMNCNIETISINGTAGEKQTSNELIDILTNNRQKSRIINKNSKNNKHANELVEILKGWGI